MAATHVSGRTASMLQKISHNLRLYTQLRCCSSTQPITEILKSNSEQFSGKEDARFKDQRVQNLLHRMTERNLDLEKVFRARQETLNVPTYKLLTDEELAEEEKSIKEEALQRLEFPPVMHEREEINYVIRKDPEIDGHDKSNFVFTDISTSKNSRNRRIVVREPNGVLREASWEERERMNFLYLPRDGQSYEMPPMLTDERLPVVFEQLRHVDALDLVSIQCPPDSADYLRVHKRTYEDIDNKRLYYLLESTRHYGGMVYHFVLNKRINGLLLRLMKEDRIEDAADVVRIYHVMYPVNELEKEADPMKTSAHDLLMAYARQAELEEIVSILSNESFRQERKEV